MFKISLGYALYKTSFLVFLGVVNNLCCSIPDKVQVWTSNPNQFVEDEDDDTFSFSVRIAAQDVLLVSMENVEF